MTQPSPLHLFEAIGIEIEYMIVDAESLDVCPVADELLTRTAGEPVTSVERGAVAWSNELALHVIELKTNGPTSNLAEADAAFQKDVAAANATLRDLGACLLPTGMHPWMDPERELRLWPHENDVIYQTFDRIFDCRGHGWANLQSMHINLPFHGDAEFGALHAAIRTVLPLLPALGASSPVEESRITGFADTRLVHYSKNARRIPSICGRIVPERVYTEAAYQSLLQGIYADLKPHDPEGVLCEEWVNGRGAIARFDRQAIEIRLLDTQECPTADFAIASLVVAAVRHLTERAMNEPRLHEWPEQRLATLLESTIISGDKAWLDDADYLELLTGSRRSPRRAGEIWAHWADELPVVWAPHQARCLELIFSKGCLARRIQDQLGPEPSRAALRSTYAELAKCLASNTQFGR